MFQARRIELAREALPSVVAWAELVVGPERASTLASDAVVAAASQRGAATLPHITHDAREQIARALAHGECRVPTLPALDSVTAVSVAGIRRVADVGHETPTETADAADQTDAPAQEASAAPYLPDTADASPTAAMSSDAAAPTDDARATPHHTEPEPDRRTPAERLADALPALHPHERLAAVRYYLDGESVDQIAELFEVTRDDAVGLLESVTAVLAPLVGEHDLPDFASEATEIEVVTR